MNQTRATIALTVASVLCAWGAVEAWQWENGYQTHNHDPYQLRFQEVRLLAIQAAVPESAEMGYISDLAPGGNADLAAFNSARYVLAPRLLRRGTHEKWVLGIMSKTESVAKLAEAHGLVVVQPFNNGAVLYGHGGAQ